MSTFKERLEIESSELDDKARKLVDFIESDKFNDIEPIQQSLLRAQKHAMLTYGQILHERLKWLKTD